MQTNDSKVIARETMIEILKAVDLMLGYEKGTEGERDYWMSLSGSATKPIGCLGLPALISLFSFVEVVSTIHRGDKVRIDNKDAVIKDEKPYDILNHSVMQKRIGLPFSSKELEQVKKIRNSINHNGHLLEKLILVADGKGKAFEFRGGVCTSIDLKKLYSICFSAFIDIFFNGKIQNPQWDLQIAKNTFGYLRKSEENRNSPSSFNNLQLATLSPSSSANITNVMSYEEFQKILAIRID